MSLGSEYGGKPHILQDRVGDTTDRGTVAPGHEELTPNEMLRNGNRAGTKEAGGVPFEILYDEDGLPMGTVPYSEEQARIDYETGTNF